LGVLICIAVYCNEIERNYDGGHCRIADVSVNFGETKFMEKSPRIGAQVYGYTVCVVSVITFLICIANLMNAVFDIQDPIHSGFNPQGSPSLASYENYKMDILKNLPKTDATNLVPEEQTLRAMYEAARNDKIVAVRSQATRNLTINSVLIAICLILFVTHWRWIRKMNKPGTKDPVALAATPDKMLVVD
jgi:hypothetical protein